MSNDVFSGFGTPSFGSKAAPRLWKSRKLAVPDFKKGESKTVFTARILPPLKSLKDNEFGWHQKHDVFWGYDGMSQDKSKTRSRPFVVSGVSALRNNPAQNRIDQKTKEMETLEAKLKAASTSEVELKNQLQPYVDWIKKHNRDTKYYLNVLGEDDELYVLMLSGTTFKRLKSKMEELDAEGTNPLDPKAGVWFRFTRTDAKGAEDDVSVVKEMRTFEGGVKAEVTKAAPLSDEMAQKVLQHSPDLVTDVVRYLTLDQVERLVNGPEEPDFVDSVWSGESKVQPGTLPNESDADKFFNTLGQ